MIQQLFIALYASCMFPVLIRIFSPEIRYTGIALCYNLTWATMAALPMGLTALLDFYATPWVVPIVLSGIAGLSVRSAQTNIVFVDVADGRGPALLAHLKDHGVLATGLIGLRFVTHLDVDAAGIDRVLEVVRGFFAGAGQLAAGVQTPGGVY